MTKSSDPSSSQPANVSSDSENTEPWQIIQSTAAGTGTTDISAAEQAGGSGLVVFGEYRPQAYQAPFDIDKNTQRAKSKTYYSPDVEPEHFQRATYEGNTNNDADVTDSANATSSNEGQRQSFRARQPQHFSNHQISTSAPASAHPLEEYALPHPLAYEDSNGMQKEYTGSYYQAMDDNGPIVPANSTAANNDDSTDAVNAPNNMCNKDTSKSTLSSTSSSSSRAARWFALETTPEDRLSFHIIKTEIKTVLSELLHFAKTRNWKKKVVTVLVMTLSCLVFIDLLFLGHIREWIRAFLVWMTEHPVHAEFAFIGIFVLATLLFVPPTLLLVGAGWAFAKAVGMFTGILAAVVSCFLGSCIGSLLSFVRARYMMRDLIQLFIERYPIVRAADQALKRDGFRIMLLLRLCPLIPFHGLNYLGGITGLDWETFLCSLVGMLPYQILVIVMGASAGTMHEYESQEKEATDQEVPNGTNVSQQIGMIIVTSAGVATFLIAMILAFRFTKKELQKEFNLGDGEMESYITTVRRMSHIDFYDEKEVAKEVEVEVQNDNKQQPLPQTPIRSNSKGNDKDDPEAGIHRFILCPTFIPK